MTLSHKYLQGPVTFTLDSRKFEYVQKAPAADIVKTEASS